MSPTLRNIACSVLKGVLFVSRTIYKEFKESYTRGPIKIWHGEKRADGSFVGAGFAYDRGIGYFPAQVIAIRLLREINRYPKSSIENFSPKNSGKETYERWGSSKIIIEKRALVPGEIEELIRTVSILRHEAAESEKDRKNADNLIKRLRELKHS